MNQSRNKIRIVFEWIYAIASINILWFLGLLLGLGIFSHVTSTVVAFQLVNQMHHARTRDRLRIWKSWWSLFKEQYLEYLIPSLLFSLLFFVLIVNYLYFQGSSGLLGLVLFYLMIFIFLLSLFIYIWFCGLRSYYPENSKKEIFRNAVAYTMVYLLETVLYAALVFVYAMIVWQINLGLLVFTGIGVALSAASYMIHQILEGKSLKDLFKWRKNF